MDVTSSSNQAAAYSNTINPSLLKRIQKTIFSVIALSLVLFAIFAVDMARVNMLPLFEDNLMESRNALHERILSEDNAAIQLDELYYRGLWPSLMRKVTSSEYVLDKKGIDTIFDLYATMPAFNSTVLMLHNLMGGVCLFIGIFQFAPGFRQRNPELHKKMGKVYFYVVLLAMTGSITYLSITPHDHIFGGDSFRLGLWGLAIACVITLLLAVYTAKQGKLAQHQLFMALNYSTILTAPLLRYNWTLIGLFLPEQNTFDEGNWASTLMLAIQVPLCAYLLLVINRRGQKNRKTLPSINPGSMQAKVIYLVSSTPLPIGLILIPMATYGYQFIIKYTSDSVLLNSDLLASAASHEWNTLAPLVLARYGFSITAAGTLLLSVITLRSILVFQLNTANTQKLDWKLPSMLAVSTAFFGLFSLYFANNLGGPSDTTLSVGVLYACIGVLALIFGLLVFGALLYGNLPALKEYVVFCFCVGLMLPMYYFATVLRAAPDATLYEQSHQMQMMLSESSLVLFIGVVYAAFGEQMRKKYVR